MGFWFDLEHLYDTNSILANLDVKVSFKFMKLISETAEYSLRIILWMVHANEPQTTGRIAEGTRIPADYLRKVLQQLVRAGLVKSRRGRGGGFCLQVDADELSVLDVVEKIDPIQKIETCPLGLAKHGRCLCPLHSGLNTATERLREALAMQKLSELLRPGPPSFPLGMRSEG